ncbi:hypothetical protein HDU98_000934, partial [Podochytrium sp. JEL0797]
MRLDTAALKKEVSDALGSERAPRYFALLGQMLTGKLAPGEFRAATRQTLAGAAEMNLHNSLVLAILANANTQPAPHADPARAHALLVARSFKRALTPLPMPIASNKELLRKTKEDRKLAKKVKRKLSKMQTLLALNDHARMAVMTNQTYLKDILTSVQERVRQTKSEEQPQFAIPNTPPGGPTFAMSVDDGGADASGGGTSGTYNYYRLPGGASCGSNTGIGGRLTAEDVLLSAEVTPILLKRSPGAVDTLEQLLASPRCRFPARVTLSLGCAEYRMGTSGHVCACGQPAGGTAAGFGGSVGGTQFPLVLCEMRQLEILDSLGPLQTTLKVFSIAKNKLVCIPEYFGSMQQLDIFKIDGNPLQWPSKEILESPTNALKEYLKSNPMPNTPTFKPISTTSPTSTPTPTCTESVETYLLTAPHRTSHTPTSVKNLLQSASTLHATLAKQQRCLTASSVSLKPGKSALVVLDSRLGRLVAVLMDCDREGMDGVQNGGAAGAWRLSSVVQQAVVDVVDAMRGAVVEARVAMLHERSGGGMDVRLLRSVVGGVCEVQRELFDAVERIGEGECSGMEGGGGEEGQFVGGEWRFGRRKEVVQVVENVVECCRDAVGALKGVDGVGGVVVGSVEKGLALFVKSRGRLGVASSGSFDAFQAFGEDTVSFVE